MFILAALRLDVGPVVAEPAPLTDCVFAGGRQVRTEQGSMVIQLTDNYRFFHTTKESHNNMIIYVTGDRSRLYQAIKKNIYA